MLASQGSARQGSNGVQVSLQGHNDKIAVISDLHCFPVSEPQSRAPFGFWGINPRSASSGGSGCNLRVSRALRWGSEGIKLRSPCQSCASFGFWGIKPRSGKSCALLGLWGNKAAICMSVARSGWVLGDQAAICKISHPDIALVGWLWAVCPPDEFKRTKPTFGDPSHFYLCRKWMGGLRRSSYWKEKTALYIWRKTTVDGQEAIFSQADFFGRGELTAYGPVSSQPSDCPCLLEGFNKLSTSQAILEASED
ncbi:hypothetical protein B0H14DRAFT_2613963 [Mycena olivaceomarginata]|nr:hypothetical protein B0H14DRAFT_2613963 [Mycena olivaceomarginata]